MYTDVDGRCVTDAFFAVKHKIFPTSNISNNWLFFALHRSSKFREVNCFLGAIETCQELSLKWIPIIN